MKNKKRLARGVIISSIMAVVIATTAVLAALLNVSPSLVISPIRRGENTTAVALMIVANRDSGYLNQMLEILEGEDATATVFISGILAANNPELVKRIHQSGFEIGSLGFFYVGHEGMDEERILTEFEISQNIIGAIVDSEIKYFLPPMGSFCNSSIKIAERSGLTTVLGTVNLKTENLTADSVFENATTNLEGGEFISLYPCSQTVLALPRIIESVRNSGLVLANLGQVIE